MKRTVLKREKTIKSSRSMRRQHECEHQSNLLDLKHIEKKIASEFASMNSSELLADITHYIHKPGAYPIFIDKETLGEWSEMVGKLNGAFMSQVKNAPFRFQKKPSFRFIDLFAGIGGFRLALQALGGECAFSSEWDRAAKRTYFMNFGEVPFGDIKKFTGDNISDSMLDRLVPDHDVLAAGFPCQPFSLAGVSARGFLGKDTGFDCKIQGSLFFDIVRIAKVKRPKVLLLENVKNLMSHDSGNTFKIIREVIEQDLKYSFSSDIINASSLVPQKRERCYMVCFSEATRKFTFPVIKGPQKILGDILERNVPEKYTISDALWRGHKRRTKRNLARGTGFTAFEARLDRPANTLVSRYGKDGKECLIPQKNKNPRKLTPRECASLQGFPRNFILPPSDAPSYRQFGNSIAVPVVKVIAKKMIEELENNG